MSYFLDDAVLVDEHPREAVAEGVHLERRSLLRFSAATVAAGLAAACYSPTKAAPAEILERSPTPPTDGSLDIAAFLAEMYPRAKGFVASGGEREEAYLMAVGELMARLRTPTYLETQAAMKEFHESHGTEDQRFEMWVAMYKLAPRQGFSHHDHRDYNGVILGVDGEARVTNYDILGDTLVPPKEVTFQIRQTRDDTILPGRFSSLGTTRENVHELKAGPRGAVVLDVFTFLAPDATSHYMEVDLKARDAEKKIYDATWV